VDLLTLSNFFLSNSDKDYYYSLFWGHDMLFLYLAS